MSRPIALCVSSPYEEELSPGLKRLLWHSFMVGKATTHSAQAATLPFFIRRAERRGIPYVLKAMPGIGYSLQRAEELQEIKNYGQEAE